MMSYSNKSYIPYENYKEFLEEKTEDDENIEEETKFINNCNSPYPQQNNKEIHDLLLKFYTFINIIYIINCILIIIQGIGIILYLQFYNIILGLYIILFGIILLTFDIIKFNKYYNDNFNFLNNLLGRSLTILYFSFVSYSTYFNHFWNIFVMIFNIVTSILYFILYIIEIFEIFQYDDITDIYTGI